MKKVLVVGATSAIAEACCRIFAQRGDMVYLVGRRAGKLKAIEEDLGVRGCPRVGSSVLDLTDWGSHGAMLDAAAEALGGFDTVLIAYGTLSDQKACQESVEATLNELQTNALSVVALLTEVAKRFEQQGRGTIAAISSVAGDRGRQSNYVYGASKAMVSAFLSGLRQRLGKRNIAVITVKPGFVDTPMTRAFKKGLLWATPEQVARRIVKAMDGNGCVCYVPWFWRPIMAIITHIPEFLFRRISL